MSLIEYDLFRGKVDKVKIAIARLKEFEPPEGYYLAFSGGKDSQTIYELAKLSKVKFEAQYHVTTVDPPELIYFMRKNYPDVIFNKPEMSMWKLIVKKQMPPTRIVRYCCEYLKERKKSNAGRFIVTGVRWEESYKRSRRKMVEVCMKDKTKKYLHPIIDWTNGDVWEFIKLKKLKYCCLYDEGFKRIGCVGCPMSGTRGMEREFKRYPRIKKAYLKTFQKMIDHRNELKKEKNWKTPEEVMRWWIYGGRPGHPDQTVMFE